MCGVSVFFNDTATTEIYTLSLHDALPICSRPTKLVLGAGRLCLPAPGGFSGGKPKDGASWGGKRPAAISSLRARLEAARSGEHTSEIQSRQYIGCRLLL